MIAVLGKRLKNDRITKEYSKRIEFLINELQSGRVKADLIGFSGGKAQGSTLSEAQAGVTHFESLVKSASLKATEPFCDDRSGNTIENVRNILLEVQKRVECPGKDVSLTLVSSDYHLDRLEIIDRRMPAQSLLKPVWEMVGELNLLRAPYPYPNDWKGELYLKADTLTIMRVNVEGVLQWKIENILSENVRDFRDTLLSLSKHLQSNVMQSVQIQVDRALGHLMPSCFQLAVLASQNQLSEQNRRQLDLTYRILDDGIKMINQATDPDEPL